MILEPRPRQFECPTCRLRIESRQQGVAMHPCKATGLTMPMVEVEPGKDLDLSQVRHVLNEREDYVGDAEQKANGEYRRDSEGRPLGLLPRVDGRIIMSVSTERADGSNDSTVYAPSATNS